MIKEKQHRILDAILYYKIINFIIVTIIIWELREPVLQMIVSYFEVRRNTVFYTSFYLTICWVPLFFWVYYVFCRIRSLRYKKLTNGRNYSSDVREYNKTYSWLVDFFVNKSDPHRLDTTEAPKRMKWTDAKGIVMGITEDNRLVYIPSYCESNLCTIGAPGSGKTRGHAIVNAITFGGSVLAIDQKGDIYDYVSKHSNRKILRFCPDAPNALDISVHFDPLAGFHRLSPTDQKMFLSNMAIILVPEESGESGSYFTGRARRILRAISTYLLWKDKTTSFADIVHGVLQGNIFDWANEIAGSECASAKELILSLMDGNEKNAGGAYDTLATALDPFSDGILDVLLSNKHGKCISVKELEKGYDIYLQIEQEHLEVYAPLLTLIIQSFMMQFMRRKDSATGVKNRPILFLLDEFAQLSFSYKMANTAFSTLRSKGIVIDMLLQDRAQLEKKYGDEGARALLACCNYQLFFSSNDAKSSQAYSELFGKKKVLVQSNSLSSNGGMNNSSGITTTEQYEDIYSPQDFGDLTSTNEMIRYYKGKHAKLKKIKAT